MQDVDRQGRQPRLSKHLPDEALADRVLAVRVGEASLRGTALARRAGSRSANSSSGQLAAKPRVLPAGIKALLAGGEARRLDPIISWRSPAWPTLEVVEELVDRLADAARRR